MAVITLALVSRGHLAGKQPDVPFWVVVCAASAIALGTDIGGWRIIRTMGHGITDIEAPRGFAAETSSAATIVAAPQAGSPLSTTHVTAGGVMGAGLGKRATEVRWGLAGRMATAWLLTLPAAATMAAAVYLSPRRSAPRSPARSPAACCSSSPAEAAGRARARRALGGLLLLACMALVAYGLYIVFTTK